MNILTKEQLKTYKTVNLLQLYFDTRHELKIREHLGDFDEIKRKQKVAVLKL